MLIWACVSLKYKYIKVNPEESFTDAYVEEIFDSEIIHTSTKQLCKTLDAKHKKSGLNRNMKEQCQHLTEDKQKDLLNLFFKIK